MDLSKKILKFVKDAGEFRAGDVVKIRYMSIAHGGYGYAWFNRTTDHQGWTPVDYMNKYVDGGIAVVKEKPVAEEVPSEESLDGSITEAYGDQKPETTPHQVLLKKSKSASLWKTRSGLRIDIDGKSCQYPEIMADGTIVYANPDVVPADIKKEVESLLKKNTVFESRAHNLGVSIGKILNNKKNAKKTAEIVALHEEFNRIVTSLKEYDIVNAKDDRKVLIDEEDDEVVDNDLPVGDQDKSVSEHKAELDTAVAEWKTKLEDMGMVNPFIIHQDLCTDKSGVFIGSNDNLDMDKVCENVECDDAASVEMAKYTIICLNKDGVNSQVDVDAMDIDIDVDSDATDDESHAASMFAVEVLDFFEGVAGEIKDELESICRG